MLCVLHKVEGVSLAVGLKRKAGRREEGQSSPASCGSPPESCSEEPGEPGRSLAEAVQQNPQSSFGANAELGAEGSGSL